MFVHAYSAPLARPLRLARLGASRAEELDTLKLVVAHVGAKERPLLVHLAQESEARVPQPLVC